jgi:CRP-like cAMP-binding protein
MTNKQLERVIPRIQQKTINRGAVLYSEGDDADGVYFIANGAFEITHRKHHIRDIEKATEKMRIDPIARQQLKKKTIV